MGHNKYEREYRLDMTVGTVAIAVSLMGLAMAFACSDPWLLIQPKELDFEFFGRIVVILVCLGIATRGIFILANREPQLIIDRKGLVDFRQRRRKLALRWKDIVQISLDIDPEKLGILSILVMEDGKPETYQVRVGKLDETAERIYDAVLRNHSVFGSGEPRSAPPPPELPPEPRPKIPPEPLPELPPEPPTPERSRTEAFGRKSKTGDPRGEIFWPRKRFKPDLRIVGACLSVFGIVGTILSIIIDGGDVLTIQDELPVILTITSMTAGIVGGLLLIMNVSKYGWGKLPTDGWPILRFKENGLTLERDKGDKLHIPWNRLRKVVREIVRYDGKSEVVRLAIYYFSKQGLLKKYSLEMHPWANRNAILDAFDRLSLMTGPDPGYEVVEDSNS